MATKRRVKETYTRWDPVDNLKSEADVQAYLIASFEEASRRCRLHCSGAR
jgi:DNA-binding phage protein